MDLILLAGHEPFPVALLHIDLAQHVPRRQPGDEREQHRRLHQGAEKGMQMRGTRKAAARCSGCLRRIAAKSIRMTCLCKGGNFSFYFDKF
jgi:hypothetical protein